MIQPFQRKVSTSDSVLSRDSAYSELDREKTMIPSHPARDAHRRLHRRQLSNLIESNQTTSIAASQEATTSKPSLLGLSLPAELGPTSVVTAPLVDNSLLAPATGASLQETSSVHVTAATPVTSAGLSLLPSGLSIPALSEGVSLIAGATSVLATVPTVLVSDASSIFAAAPSVLTSLPAAVVSDASSALGAAGSVLVSAPSAVVSDATSLLASIPSAVVSDATSLLASIPSAVVSDATSLLASIPSAVVSDATSLLATVPSVILSDAASVLTSVPAAVVSDATSLLASIPSAVISDVTSALAGVSAKLPTDLPVASAISAITSDLLPSSTKDIPVIPIATSALGAIVSDVQSKLPELASSVTAVIPSAPAAITSPVSLPIGLSVPTGALLPTNTIAISVDTSAVSLPLSVSSLVKSTAAVPSGITNSEVITAAKDAQTEAPSAKGASITPAIEASVNVTASAVPSTPLTSFVSTESAAATASKPGVTSINTPALASTALSGATDRATTAAGSPSTTAATGIQTDATQPSSIGKQSVTDAALKTALGETSAASLASSGAAPSLTTLSDGEVSTIPPKTSSQRSRLDGDDDGAGSTSNAHLPTKTGHQGDQATFTGGAGGSWATDSAPLGISGDSGSTSISSTTSALAGGIVGGLAGIAALFLVALMFIKWYRKQHEVSEIGDGPQPGSPTTPITPITPISVAMAERTGLLPSNYRRTLLPSPVSPATSTGERGFQRLAGRKLPSARSPGMSVGALHNISRPTLVQMPLAFGSDIPGDRSTTGGSEEYRFGEPFRSPAVPLNPSQSGSARQARLHPGETSALDSPLTPPLSPGRDLLENRAPTPIYFLPHSRFHEEV